MVLEAKQRAYNWVYHQARTSWALFTSEKFWKMDTVAFSFVFDKYCPIID